MQDRRDGKFYCLKWNLFFLIVVKFALSLFIFIFFTIKYTKEPKVNEEYQDTFYEQKRTATLILSVCFLTVLSQVLGLFATYTENYCQSFIYAIIMTIESWVTIWAVMHSPITWLCLILNVVICILGYIFAADLRKLRRGSASTRVTPQPPSYVNPGFNSTTELNPSAPPAYLGHYSPPPPPYHAPPSYADSLAMAKNYQVQNFDNYPGNRYRRDSSFSAHDFWPSASSMSLPR